MAIPRLPEKLGQISSPKQSHRAIQHKKDAVSCEIIVSGSYHFIDLAPIVQTLDSAILRINHYPADKYYGNQLRYPLDNDLSCG